MTYGKMGGPRIEIESAEEDLAEREYYFHPGKYVGRVFINPGDERYAFTLYGENPDTLKMNFEYWYNTHYLSG